MQNEGGDESGALKGDIVLDSSTADNADAPEAGWSLDEASLPAIYDEENAGTSDMISMATPYPTTVSSLGMTSVVSRQRRLLEDQIAIQHAQLMSAGRYNNSDGADEAMNVHPGSSGPQRTPVTAERITEVHATPVDVDAYIHELDKSSAASRKCLGRRGVLALVAITAVTVIGLVVYFVTARLSTNGQNDKLVGTEGSSGDDGDAGEDDAIISVSMDPFKMELVINAEEDLVEHTVVTVVQAHLGGFMEGTIANYESLELDVTTTDGKLLRHNRGRRTLQEGEETIFAYFDGQVKIKTNSVPVDLNTIQAIIQTVVARAFSEPNIDLLFSSLISAGVSVKAVTVFDSWGNEIGSSGLFVTEPSLTLEPAYLATPSPTLKPNLTPTQMPTQMPAQMPTQAPAQMPTQAPAQMPTQAPKASSTSKPTQKVTEGRNPISTSIPTRKPSPLPSFSPTKKPVTQTPVTEPTKSPTNEPTKQPTGGRVPTLLVSTSGNAVFDPSTAQNKAFEWLVYDDKYALEDASDERIVERYVIALLYFSLGGDNWWNSNGFLSSSEVCQWFGVNCDNDGNVESLNWASNKLSGRLPAEIKVLRELKDLHMHSKADLPGRMNEITGSLPASIGDLHQLEDLRLYRCGLTGTIPSSIGKLAELRRLMLTENELVGSLPDSLGDLEKIVGGTLPPTLGRLQRLEDLRIGNTEIYGQLPTELGQLTRLNVVNLQKNALTGTIISELGALAELETLWLDDNKLTGAIPPVLGNLLNLESLFLDSNMLTGDVPTSLHSLTVLEELRLHNNELKGSLPDSICDLFETRGGFLMS